MIWRAAVVAWFALAQTAFAQDCADMDLVLALDASGSITGPEFDLQKAGYAAALQDPAVVAALQSVGTVDIAVLVWADTEAPLQVIPWQRLRTAADARSLAQTIAGLPRLTSGNTGMGRAVWAALDLLQEPGRCAMRQVINLSGDGRPSLSPRPLGHVPLMLARDRAADLGVTINALAITRNDATLPGWFETHLMTGSDAFVMSVAGFDRFAAAMVTKLVREIRPPMLAALRRAQP
jgi:hypothetical protein